MPSSTALPTSEKKRKSGKTTSSKSKKPSSKQQNDNSTTSLLGEPVKATKKKSRSASKKLKDQVNTEDETTTNDITEEEGSKLDDATQQVTDKLDQVQQEGITDQINDVTEQANDDANDKIEQVSEEAQGLNADEADQLIEQARNKVAAIVGNSNNDDSDDEEEQGDADALTTMNAILEYNRMLVRKFQEFEKRTRGFNKQDVQGAVNGTLNEVSAKYNKKDDSKGVHQSFELPIGDMMKGYGSLSSTPLPDDAGKEEAEEPRKKHEDEESTVKGDDTGKIRIGDGEKDDIVIKVEATKTGITFSIHIPRN